MCELCHSKLSDETVLGQLTHSLKNPNFDQWNTTSLGHVLISASGKNGEEARKVAIQLAEEFYKWYVGPSNGIWELFGAYRPHSGLVAFPPIKEVRRLIDEAIYTNSSNE